MREQNHHVYEFSSEEAFAQKIRNPTDAVGG